MRFQEAIQNRNQEVSDDEQLIFRIGINMGDVIEEGGNLLGRGKHRSKIRGFRSAWRSLYFSTNL